MSAAAHTQISISCRVPIFCPVERPSAAPAERKDPEAASCTTARCSGREYRYAGKDSTASATCIFAAFAAR